MVLRSVKGTWHTIIKQHERAEQFAKNVTIAAVTARVGALVCSSVAALVSAVEVYMHGTAIGAVVVSRMEKNDDSNKPK